MQHAQLRRLPHSLPKYCTRHIILSLDDTEYDVCSQQGNACLGSDTFIVILHDACIYTKSTYAIIFWSRLRLPGCASFLLSCSYRGREVGSQEGYFGRGGGGVGCVTEDPATAMCCCQLHDCFTHRQLMNKMSTWHQCANIAIHNQCC